MDLHTSSCSTLKTHYVYSMLKRRRNGRFHIVSTWNTRGVFVGKQQTNISSFVVLNNPAYNLSRAFPTSQAKKIVSLFFGNRLGENFFITHPSAQQNKQQNIYFQFQKQKKEQKKTHQKTRRQKAKETKDKKRRPAEILTV